MSSSRPISSEPPRLSVLVSTYQAADWLPGCLDSLLQQSIADQLEILVIDSASEQDEMSIVRRYQAHHPRLHYLRTARREGLYAAWNRGIKMASAACLTNANTDDRHREDALELLLQALDEHPEAALAYADSLVTETPYQCFDTCQDIKPSAAGDYDHVHLLERCYIAPHPVWRASMHRQVGLFNDAMESAADYDMWLRMAELAPFVHVPQYLSLFYVHADNISRRGGRAVDEARWCQQHYRARYLKQHALQPL